MKFETVELTAEQERAWNNVMRMMEWTTPSFRYLWYRMLQNHNGKASAIMARFDNPYTKKPGVAKTDGQNIVINPDTFLDKERYSLPERVFIGAHEVAHCVYDDPGTIRRMRGQSNITCTDGSRSPMTKGSCRRSWIIASTPCWSKAASAPCRKTPFMILRSLKAKKVS